MKFLTIAFTKVTSIFIHHLSSYKIYKRCHMTFVQVAEHNPPTKTKGAREPCSHTTGYIPGYKLSSYLLA
jgi:hypothetical protein